MHKGKKVLCAAIIACTHSNWSKIKTKQRNYFYPQIKESIFSSGRFVPAFLVKCKLIWWSVFLRILLQSSFFLTQTLYHRHQQTPSHTQTCLHTHANMHTLTHYHSNFNFLYLPHRHTLTCKHTHTNTCKHASTHTHSHTSTRKHTHTHAFTHSPTRKHTHSLQLVIQTHIWSSRLAQFSGLASVSLLFFLHFFLFSSSSF